MRQKIYIWSTWREGLKDIQEVKSRNTLYLLATFQFWIGLIKFQVILKIIDTIDEDVCLAWLVHRKKWMNQAKIHWAL